ncbi:unnamed protein product [Symbiodinium microadriaticum]|nr:unnamed protein product [Symbiodinium microadriaticum]
MRPHEREHPNVLVCRDSRPAEAEWEAAEADDVEEADEASEEAGHVSSEHGEDARTAYELRIQRWQQLPECPLASRVNQILNQMEAEGRSLMNEEEISALHEEYAGEPSASLKKTWKAGRQRSRWSGWEPDHWEGPPRHMGYRGYSGRDPLLISVARMALRHEEELKLLQQDKTMVLWFSPGQDSVLPYLYQTALTFKKRQQAEPTWGLAHVPLKQVMATAMFRELRERHAKVLQSQELLKKATDMGWRDNQGWVYQVWNPQLKHLERDHHRAPVPDVEMTNKLEFFITHLKRDVVHRFHCNRKLTETMDSKATFHLDLSVRNKHAEEIWDLMMELQDNTVFQLIGLGYRRERLGRGPGAQKVYDMLRSL